MRWNLSYPRPRHRKKEGQKADSIVEPQNGPKARVSADRKNENEVDQVSHVSHVSRPTLPLEVTDPNFTAIRGQCWKMFTRRAGYSVAHKS